MEFGKIDIASRRIPLEAIILKQPQSNSHVLSSLEGNSRFQAGLPTWSGKSLAKEIYPDHTAPKDYLAAYSKSFNCIELNSTFYSLPSDQIIEKWKSSVPQEFRFHPKAPKSIGHRLGSYESLSTLKSHYHFLQQLESHCGTTFFQFPTSFGPLNYDLLISFLHSLSKGFDYFIELRHPHWFNNKSLWSKLCAELYHRDIGLVITDTLGRRDACHMQLINNKTMIRFLGNSLHPSDFQRIDQWKIILKEWIESGIEEVLFFIHQPSHKDGIALYQYMRKKWPQLPAIQLKQKQLSFI